MQRERQTDRERGGGTFFCCITQDSLHFVVVISYVTDKNK